MNTFYIEESSSRIDKYLMNKLELSRSKVQKLIDNNLILVNDKPVKNSYSLKLNDKVEVLTTKYEEEINIEAQDIPLDIVYEDEYLLVINKPSGMVVHPAIGNYQDTLVNALMFHFNNLPNNNSYRPGIVHRIDKDTSGLLIVAKTEETLELLSEMIRKHEVIRKYKALVHGTILNDSGTIDAPIGRDTFDRKKMTVTKVNSKESITHFKVLERYENHTLIECRLETGRTHQIRVHLRYIKFPIVNDLVYGRKKVIDETFGQLLHAYYINFKHPITNEILEFESSLPPRFNEILNLVTKVGN